ncbi:SpoIIE family protein phosphatase [Spirochaeta thermophila]|uniref:HAMP domain protein n=1 Tax=Winmispira thermophila (strain ATCC 49972 / DSM 6192 / RI 19.B1) TaxID=665571 RepID=E0RSB2_WINT6|nr:SpoIIE family protein phosphatase [Spirochaeta thermophila]ADN01899.1 HAMP domain protein [Spirochaeta thermophila DSM 6192]
MRRLLPLCVVAVSLFVPWGMGAQELYWEAPHVMGREGARFIQGDTGGGLAVIGWEEFYRRGSSRVIGVFVSAFRAGGQWSEPSLVTEVPFVGDETAIYSLLVDRRGRVFVALTYDERTTRLFISEDGGSSFSSFDMGAGFDVSVGPRLFETQDGGYLLFVNQSIEDSLSLFYARSSDGRTWSSFAKLEERRELELNFLPAHASWRGREYVVYQSFGLSERGTYQLYCKVSTDGGRTWSPAVPLTHGEDPQVPDAAFQDFDNQRPFLAVVDDRLYLIWERTYARNPTQIYLLELTSEGAPAGPMERISSGDYAHYAPRIFPYRGRPYVLWLDTGKGEEHVRLAYRVGLDWRSRDLSPTGVRALFPFPLLIDDDLFIFWEQRQGPRSRIVFLEPDRSVSPPRIAAEGVRDGARSRTRSVRIRWSVPSDSSGIAGFSYVWSQDPSAPVPHRLMVLEDTTEVTVEAVEDGPWYFRIIAQDYAGNWSEPATFSYILDTSPPGKVVFEPLPYDEEGFLPSNTFSVSWTPPPDEPVAGYSYRLEYVRPNRSDELVSFREEGQPGDEEPVRWMEPELPEGWSPSPPPAYVMTEDPILSFRNLDNGLWALSVRAVDTVGNAGPPQVVFFRLNKYVPVTYITYVDARKDDLGRVALTIHGRGFAEGGEVHTIFLDEDGKEPYHYVFSLERGEFTVRSDRVIAGPVIDNPDEGRYYVGVIHPTRGRSITGRPLIALEPGGTVKIGYFGDYSLPVTLLPVPRYSISSGTVAVVLVMLTLLVVSGVAGFQLAGVMREQSLLTAQARALVKGMRLPGLTKQEVVRMRRRGMSLRVKFTLLFTVLVITVVLLVAIPLGAYMISTQERSLARALKERTEVLLESLASGARTYLPSQSTLELLQLPAQISAMEEALSATITGFAGLEPDAPEIVWASNDSQIASRIDTPELVPGESVLTDDVTPLRIELVRTLNERAREALGDLPRQIDSLGREALALATRTDEASRMRLQDLQETIRTLDARMRAVLQQVGNVVGSVPTFDPEDLDYGTTTYTFFKPVLYRVRGEDAYVRGMVRLTISTERIIQEVASSRAALIRITALITVAALLLGIGGALLLSAITVNPIKKLVAGVEVIRDTEDKEKLADHVIEVKSRDELALLAETINEMTQGLVKAAAANKELIVGKEVQKMFIPLRKDEAGRKLTTAEEEDERVSLFGYYEGAKGVSGDYFYYQKVDREHYAFIKCDVAGKGVPAALIMVEVATIFLNYCQNLDVRRDGVHLDRLLSEINDLIAGREFKGRFAAMTVGLYNERTGRCFVSNAGDTLLHYFSAAERHLKEVRLPTAPAAGVFDSSLVEMQGGFKQISLQLSPGDILILFTDGLEEAQRVIKNPDYTPHTVTEEEIASGKVPSYLRPGEETEEFGLERIRAVVETIARKGTYRLIRVLDPDPVELVFDFSSLSSTARDMVLGLLAVEKVFRLYRDPATGPSDVVVVDRAVDEYLRRTFLQYGLYFRDPEPDPERPEYLIYRNLKEDEQYDDLTVLALQRKG